MDIVDEPSESSLSQKNNKNDQSWAQKTADEIENEDIDAGTPHETKRFTMNEVHDLSMNLLHPAGKLEFGENTKSLETKSASEPEKKEVKTQ